jgi:DNA-binding MarR family transcriptional regulator
MGPQLTASRTSSAAAQERLAESVGKLTRAWIRYGKEEARRVDLMLPQLFLLGVLFDDGPISVTRWSESIGAPPSTTTGLLDGLEGAGHILRTHDPTDRRQVLVTLTPKGRRLAERLKTQVRGRWGELCEGIPARDLESAAATLERVLVRMERDLPPHAVEIRPVASRAPRVRREV